MWYPSKYGADDILGAINLITPDTILAALSIRTEPRDRRGAVQQLNSNSETDEAVRSKGSAASAVIALARMASRLTRIEQANLPFAADFKGHQSFKELLEQQYHIITF